MKISFPVKLVISYLLVIGLAVLPAYVYLRTSVRDEVAQVLRGDLETQLVGLVGLLSQTPDETIPERVALLRAVLPQRVTVVALNGRVLADTTLAPELAENHLDRPEIQAALEGRTGTDTRTSRSTREPTLYMARRFPLEGAPRGIVRLAVSTKALDEVRRHGAKVLNNWAALAGSVALLLSLVAAVLLSRPLRRLTEAAKAFAHGDLGAPLELPTGDEVGELATALGELAAQLRTRLVTMGADRAFVHGLLDDLPVGVVLFDPEGLARVVGAAARPTLELEPEREGEQLRTLLDHADHGQLARQAKETGISVEGTLSLPWRPEQRVLAKWVPLFAPDARRELALVVRPLDPGGAARERAASALHEAAALLRKLARSMQDAGLAAEALRVSVRADAAAERPLPTPSSVTTVSLGELSRRLVDELRPLGRSAEVRLELDLPEQDVVLADADGRGEQALRTVLTGAVERSPRGALVVVHADLQPDTVRVAVRTLYELPGIDRAAQLVRPLGGDGGGRRDGDAVESWLQLPRA